MLLPSYSWRCSWARGLPSGMSNPAVGQYWISPVNTACNLASGLLLLFSRSVVSDSLRPHGLQHSNIPCPSLSPEVDDAIQPSHPLSPPFSSCSQSFPASGSYPMSWLFIIGGQSIGAPASVLLMNIHSWFPLGLTGLISLLSKEFSRVSSSTTIHFVW